MLLADYCGEQDQKLGKQGAWLWFTRWETSEKGTAGKRVFMCHLKDDTFHQGNLIHKESSRISELGT